METIRSFFTPKTCLFFILIVGLFMLFVSLRIPKYVGTNEYNLLNEQYYNEKISKEQYLVEFEKNNSARTLIMNIGNGLITFSICGLLFLFIKRINQWHDFLKLKAIKKIIIICLSNVSILLLIPGTHLYYVYRGWRGDYPPFSDSIGIPIYFNTLFYLHCLIPLNLFLLLTFIKSDLCTNLFIKPIKNSRVIAWECLFYLLFLLLLIVLVLSIIDGDHASIICNLAFLYFLLSIRAGKINYHRKKRYLSQHKTEEEPCTTC